MSISQRYICKAWNILNKITPVQIDCGSFCKSACCQGDINTGMRIIPEEEALLVTHDFILRNAKSGKICICNGHCQRQFRPFACRVFPYFPMPIQLRSGRYIIRTMPDPRALGICPMLRDESVDIDPHFLYAVSRAGRVLLKSRKTRSWLLESAEEIRLTAQLQDRLHPYVNPN